jgi:hypothetical protein
MGTMIVINPNEFVFVNCGLIPNLHNRTKDNMKLLFVDLYCITNHVATKKEWASFGKGKSNLEKMCFV